MKKQKKLLALVAVARLLCISRENVPLLGRKNAPNASLGQENVRKKRGWPKVTWTTSKKKRGDSTKSGGKRRNSNLHTVKGLTGGTYRHQIGGENGKITLKHLPEKIGVRGEDQFGPLCLGENITQTTEGEKRGDSILWERKSNGRRTIKAGLS